MRVETLEELMDVFVEDVYKKKREKQENNNRKKAEDIFENLPKELKPITMAITIAFGEDFAKTFNDVEEIIKCDRALKESVNAIFESFSAELELDYKIQVIES